MPRFRIGGTFAKFKVIANNTIEEKTIIADTIKASVFKKDGKIFSVLPLFLFLSFISNYPEK